jgi:hypothetical protein
MFVLIEIVWTIKPSLISPTVWGSCRWRSLQGEVKSSKIVVPVVPQIVAISTVPSIPSKIYKENGME